MVRHATRIFQQEFELGGVQLQVVGVNKNFEKPPASCGSHPAFLRAGFAELHCPCLAFPKNFLPEPAFREQDNIHRPSHFFRQPAGQLVNTDSRRLGFQGQIYVGAIIENTRFGEGFEKNHAAARNHTGQGGPQVAARLHQRFEPAATASRIAFSEQRHFYMKKFNLARLPIQRVFFQSRVGTWMGRARYVKRKERRLDLSGSVLRGSCAETGACWPQTEATASRRRSAWSVWEISRFPSLNIAIREFLICGFTIRAAGPTLDSL